MNKEKLDKYHERLRKASILDLIDLVAKSKPIGSIQPVHCWKSPVENFITDLQMFLYFPARESKSPLVRDFFNDVMQRPEVIRLIKILEPKIAANSEQELKRKIKDGILPQLQGKAIDFANQKFVIWVVIFALITWELRKRLELGKNPAGYNIDSSLAVYFHKLSKEPSSQKRADAIRHKALGI